MSQPHILVIDDDVLVTEVLTTYLEFQGYRVSVAHNCAAGIDRLRLEDKVDLIILDYLMPDGSGADLLRIIGESTDLQRPPVIMSSGILDPSDPMWEKLRKCLPAKSQSLIQAYVNKPYKIDAMDMAMQEVLGGDYIPSPRLKRSRQKAA